MARGDGDGGFATVSNDYGYEFRDEDNNTVQSEQLHVPQPQRERQTELSNGGTIRRTRPTPPTHNRRTTLRPPPLTKFSTFLSGSELRSLSQPHSKIINILALNSPISEQRPPSQASRIGTPSQLNSRRREDYKDNAREEKRFLRQIDSSEEEITRLRVTMEELEKSEDEMRQSVEELRRAIEERDDEMLNFMARKLEFEEFSDCGGGGECCSVAARFGEFRVSGECFLEREREI
ncbi:hypothetical protein HYC85_023062 [Camellia sinensis]|uniref:Uncharacterized protein n=1 Tax=Camellia sinensis TaxID=4442 RepID=A0A7J7GDG3_CAMSI|nr:hypothetical protein HYC85_023062 [Camellia sinensis]